ncbi:response regulator [Microcoleus asticus]
MDKFEEGMKVMQTILLVEDNPVDILLMQRAFRNEIFTNTSLQIVRDGDAAVFYLNGDGEYSDRDRYPLPAVILLDLKLPRRSGHEVLVWLKQQPELKRLPVVMLTSSKETIDVKRAYDLGVNSYLVKPIGFASLLEMMQSFNEYWLNYTELPEPRECSGL